MHTITINYQILFFITESDMKGQVVLTEFVEEQSILF